MNRGILMDPSALTALSPMDGRYAAIAAPLRTYFSEAALIRERIRVEALWFEQLTAPRLRLLAGALPPAVLERNASLARDPGPDAAEAVRSSISASITTSRQWSTSCVTSWPLPARPARRWSWCISAAPRRTSTTCAMRGC
jgi:hypothetical protein